jgi:hypothetical protein
MPAVRWVVARLLLGVATVTPQTWQKKRPAGAGVLVLLPKEPRLNLLVLARVVQLESAFPVGVKPLKRKLLGFKGMLRMPPPLLVLPVELKETLRMPPRLALLLLPLPHLCSALLTKHLIRLLVQQQDALPEMGWKEVCPYSL